MGFKSKMPPNELYEELLDYIWENRMKKEEDAKKYRLKVQIMDEEDEEICRNKF